MCMKFVETYQSKCKIKIRKQKPLQFSLKHLFFMSKIWIVARRLGCQLATTVPVLTAPGKPSTLFPGEELVTQTWSFNLCMNMFRECPRMFKRRNVYHFESFQKFSKFDPKLVHRVTFPRR